MDFPLSDGYIAIHHPDEEIVVAWAGTHRYRALVMDMAVFTLPYLQGEDMGVHGGFRDAVRGVIGRVKTCLERLANDYPSYTVIFTGHSKGGAEAALSALDLVRRIDGLQGRVRVWTFGQPRLGDAKFASHYNRVLGNVTYRVVSEADPVVAVPPRLLFDYCHHDLEVWLMNEEGDIYVGQNHTECGEDPLASSSVLFFERSIESHKNYLGLPPQDHANAEFSW
ncbi:alpha/beta-hydrolase [Martensiomyces pterosporus]|nr:alpha/beta-hydrolase [Martensiomyces pterosporus]